MEGQVGAQVAPPLFFHQPLPDQFHEAAPLGKKRDFPWQAPAFHHGQQQHQQQQQRLMGASLLPNNNHPSGSWNPKMWDWDSLNFTAKPSADASDVLHLGTQPAAVTAEVEQRKKGEESSSALTLGKGLEEDGENLTLKLGGVNFTAAEEPVARPNKRIRSRSPGSGGSYPMCQVDDCRADLSNAKDYHRRHKVCEVHSKTTRALVGKQMQRFCQQCSRFHPLSEFDEGKRSCRRRLAGHNRRRRKTQPEDVSSRLLLPGNQEIATNGNLDIASLLAILTRLQGRPASLPPLPDRDRLIQIISKINNLNAANTSSRLPTSGGIDLNVSQASQQGSLEQAPKGNGNPAVPSSMNLLTVLSAALAASASEAIASLSQGSSDSSGNDKTKIQCAEPATDVNSHSKPTRTFPSAGVVRTNCVGQYPIEVPEQPVQEARPSLPLQLFGPAEDDSPPKLGSAMKYLSSESSNPMEERSPSSSPPVTQKLFPLHSAEESMKHVRMLNCREDNATVELSTSHGWNAPLELFKDSQRRVENGTVQNHPYQAGYASSSGSDHSPSSSNSDAQDRTGRIIFKLFDKDPSNFPGTLRAQILNWLSHSPSEMESYIRPGCVVLSVYLSMPLIAWDQLEEDLLRRVTSLVQHSESDFWRNRRFLVRTSRQLVSHKDGKVRQCKSWRTWSAPELTSVSPVAVVSGQETSLVLKGRNLTVPGTKIHCTYMGKYTSKVLCSAYPGTIYDDSSVESFDFPGGSPKIFGRCFIEVENGFKGNSFPVIIADARICQELRALESEFDEDVQTEDQVQENGQPRSREDVLHFLNELGWLFQKTNTSSTPSSPDFSFPRFKYLLTFSVEQDWCALIKTLLDILAERSSRSDALSQGALEMLLEIHLLNRAVKRKCRRMVDLLLHYSVRRGNDNKSIFLFPPNLPGPGGLTPLHLAASTEDSEGMVDALTSDPQEIGLNFWDSVRDDSGQSPYMYATMKNNHSYNSLVARKLADTRNGQVSISVGNEDISLHKSWITGEEDRPAAQPSQAVSCARCAMAGAGWLGRTPRTRGLLARPYVHSMLAIAAVCVCVCLFFRGSPQIGSVAPFKWENLDFGPR
ncbi:squamosa promoter-binding-like protein 15 [Phoenix dactylifera]|uniref:Squamosa promoter-binding-like protein 15 n=1 Tax=Phoenix dactylifera TaxID=42345 RepID=A0A8B7MV93_PHODC|nr:squamosa promoter-binding-like protein 15 [Phoenix dactylifera]